MLLVFIPDLHHCLTKSKISHLIKKVWSFQITDKCRVRFLKKENTLTESLITYYVLISSV